MYDSEYGILLTDGLWDQLDQYKGRRNSDVSKAADGVEFQRRILTGAELDSVRISETNVSSRGMLPHELELWERSGSRLPVRCKRLS